MFLSSVALLLGFFVFILYSAEVNLFPGFLKRFICCIMEFFHVPGFFLHSLYLHSLAGKLTLRLLTFVFFVVVFFFCFLFFPLES